MTLRLLPTASLTLASCLFLGSVSVRAQTKSAAEIKVEAEQANALAAKQNYAAALPLYEDLHKEVPTSTFYTERLALALLSVSGEQPEAEATQTQLRAKGLLLEAKAGGDQSNLMQVLLEKLDNVGQPGKSAPPQPEGHELLQKGEAAFSKGDLAAALGFYKQALEVNPQYYSAALFAGDAEYKMNHYAEAGKWYGKAIAINPDAETAHRYWGDCLEKAGEHKQAEEQFIAGIVAEPYSRSPRVGLKQWAEANHARVVPPPVKLPARATQGKDGHINITIGDTGKKDDPEMSMGLIYSMGSALWQGERFKKEFPKEKAYRHSLPEEAESIHTMLSVVKEGKVNPKKLSASTRTLLDIEKDGMIECYILLDNPDEGVAQDYVAYRKAHRELLAQYIAKYDVHLM